MKTTTKREAKGLATTKSVPRRASKGGAKVVENSIHQSPRQRTNGNGQGVDYTQILIAVPADEAKANASSNSSEQSPSHNGDGQRVPEAEQNIAVSTLAMLQRQRVMCIRWSVRLQNSSRAFVRTFLGWNWDLPEKERERINREAQQRVDRITSGLSPAEDAPLAPLVLMNYEAQQRYDNYRKGLEKGMVELARTLPVADFCESVRGFGLLGLAIIVGECDIGSWRTVSGVWKRFGLAPKQCYRMTTKDGETAFTIPRRRRSVIWTISDSMLRSNDGKYRALYDARRKYEAERNTEFLKKSAADSKDGKDRYSKHCDLRARRIVDKELLKDLWVEWRRHHSSDDHSQLAPSRTKRSMAGMNSDNGTATPAPHETKAADHSLPDAQDVSVGSPKRIRGRVLVDNQM